MGHKKFFNFKILFFVSFLAVAGIFSAGAYIANKQAEETPIVEKAEAYSDPDSTTRVYFSNNEKWSQGVNIYYYGTSSDPNWPGPAMSKYYTNNLGEDVYVFGVPNGASHIIFNNNNSGTQTVDISFSSGTVNAYYISGTQGDGKKTVTTWNVRTVSLQVSPSGYGSISPSTSSLEVPNGTPYSISTNKLTLGSATGKDVFTATAAPQTNYYTYSFNNWTVSGSSNGSIGAATTCTANFTRSNRPYTVTFDLNGKTHGTGPAAVTTTYNTTISQPADPSAFGYNFVGWYKEALCTNPWNFASDKITASRSLYAKWEEYDDFSVEIGGESYDLVSSPSGGHLYQLSMEEDITVYDGQVIKVYKGDVEYTTSDISVGSGTNIDTNDGVWTIHNFVYTANLFITLDSNGTYTMYVNNRYDNHYGVMSGSDFYIEDRYGFSSLYDIAVYFYGGIGELDADHGEWAYAPNTSSKGFATLVSSSEGISTYKVKVPTYSGREAKWSSFCVLGFSGVSASSISFDTAYKKQGDSGTYDGANVYYSLHDDVENGVKLKGWTDPYKVHDEDVMKYDVDAECYLFIDGGPTTGEGMYVDISDLRADAGWVINNSRHLYVFFVYAIGVSTVEDAVAVQATIVPGETYIYEVTVPTYLTEDSVSWGKVVLLNNTSPTWKDEQGHDIDHKYQTQDIWFSKSMHDAKDQCICFTGSNVEQGKQEGQARSSYTDTTRANKWGSNFLSSVTCNGGVTAPSTTNWNNSNTNDFAHMSTEAKKLVRTATASESGTSLQQAVARYDYIIHIYTTSSYSDYAERTNKSKGGAYSYGAVGTYKPFELIMGGSEDNLSVIIIIIASSVSLLSITALSVLMVKKRKRKEQ